MMSRNQPQEDWRSIPEYEAYEVSSLGRVRSIPRRDSAGNRVKGCILRPKPHTGGYLRVTLSKLGRQKDWFVHRLVLTAFMGTCPIDQQGCHNDGNRKNNALSNLRWGTRSENMADKKAHGTEQLGAKHWMVRKPEWVRRGEKVPTSVLNATDVERIRDMRINGCTLQAIAQWIGCVKRENVSAIIRRLTWRHL